MIKQVSSLEEALAVFRDETVQELKICLHIGVEGAKHIAEGLKHNTTLTTLDLQTNRISGEGAKHVAEGLKHNTTLKTLDLGRNEIGVEGTKHIAEALKHNTTLTTLNLYNNFIGDKGAKHIADALKHKTALTKLNLQTNRISGEGAKHVADALKQNITLTVLNLRGNSIGNEGAKHVADALKQNKTLMILDLTANEISAHGATQLADALNYNTTLTTLDLQNNWFGVEDLIGYHGVSDVLKCRATLKTLDLRNLYIGVEGAENVAEALKHNTTLTTLNLENNQTGNEGVKHVADALKHHTTLTTLVLRNCQISVDGAKHVAEALKYNTTLTTLDLDYNQIGAEGAKHIADALKQNTTLTALDLSVNEIGDEGPEHFHNAINESIAARRRLFQWPKPPLNRKRRLSSAEELNDLPDAKRLAIECSICLEQKGQLHLLPCLHSVCEQCIHDITASSPWICRDCQEPFSSTFLPNNIVGTQTAIHCPQHTANNATTFCSDCNVLVCIACDHDASHHLYELDEAMKKIQIDLPPILDDLLMQLDQVNEAIEYIVFARSSALNKLASIKSAIQLSFEALNNNEELASQRDALLEKAQVIGGAQLKILDLQIEDLRAAKDARELALQQVQALVIGGIHHLHKYSVVRNRTNLLLKKLPELEPLVFDLLRFEQVDSQQVGRVFEYEPVLQVYYDKDEEDYEEEEEDDDDE